MNVKQLSLSSRILIALALGSIVGSLINLLLGDNAYVNTFLVDGLFELVKGLFVNSLKMLVVPLVLVSLICGTCSLTEPKMLGRLGGKSILLYLFTTAIAITLALTFATIFQPGSGVEVTNQSYAGNQAPSFIQVLANIIPSNPIDAMASGNMLQIIVFAILFGVAISFSGERGKKLGEFFFDVNEVILKLVTILMNLAPYGVFAIMAKVTAELGLEKIIDLGQYFILVIAVLIIHASLTYPLLLKLLTGLSPIEFFKKIRPAMLFAFGTASSSATLPVTMEVCSKRLGIGRTTASFTLPLGATINMDGTAIMQGVATVFFAQQYGVDLSMGDFLLVIATVTMASIGTAGVPGVGLIMLVAVLNQVNLPSDGIAMLIGIDRILDMVRTAVNITGDATVAAIVAKNEGDFSQEVFDDPKAGLEFENPEKSA